MQNEILGIALVVVGLVMLLSGAAVAIIDSIRGKGLEANAVESWWEKLLKALTAAAEAFSKLRPSSALMFTGLVAIGAGLYVLADKPL